MTLIIGVAADEAEAVRRISRKVLADVPPYRPDPEDYAWCLPDGERIVVGAYDHGTLAGFCTVDTIDQFRDLAHVPDSPAETCYVSALALEPELRGQGIGHLMLAEAVRRARDRNWKYASGHFREGASERAARRVLRDIIRAEPVRGHLGSWETYHYLLARL